VLGDIMDGRIKLTPIGETSKEYWLKLPERFKNVVLDYFEIIPNHIHGNIVIKIQDLVGADPCVSPEKKKGKHVGLPLHRMIQWYKTMTTNKYFRLNKKVIGNKLWQRNYYEHIIRDEKDLNEIREHIINNPLEWELDKENPRNIKN
jgi:putative transposase